MDARSHRPADPYRLDAVYHLLCVLPRPGMVPVEQGLEDHADGPAHGADHQRALQTALAGLGDCIVVRLLRRQGRDLHHHQRRGIPRAGADRHLCRRQQRNGARPGDDHSAHPLPPPAGSAQVGQDRTGQRHGVDRRRSHRQPVARRHAGNGGDGAVPVDEKPQQDRHRLLHADRRGHHGLDHAAGLV